MQVKRWVEVTGCRAWERISRGPMRSRESWEGCMWRRTFRGVGGLVVVVDIVGWFLGGFCELGKGVVVFGEY